MKRSLKPAIVLLISGFVAACSNSSPLSPSPAQSGPSQPSLSGNLVQLGGLDLNGYCQNAGFAGAALVVSQTGPNAAFNNWRCVDNSGRTHPFSMVQACQWQYGRNAIQAHPVDMDDAFTWNCYTNVG